jgi:hypothetical protein
VTTSATEKDLVVMGLAKIATLKWYFLAISLPVVKTLTENTQVPSYGGFFSILIGISIVGVLFGNYK